MLVTLICYSELMKLISPILAGFAAVMALVAFVSYFTFSQDSRGTAVGYFVGTAVVFAFLAFISSFFVRPTETNPSQAGTTRIARRLALVILIPIVLFIAAIYAFSWWLNRGYNF